MQNIQAKSNVSSATTKRGQGRGFAWLLANKDHEGDGCLIWPFGGCNGYGNFGHLGTVQYAHVAMCEMVNGPRPTPGHEAAHSCGNGAGGCVHPKHLSWKTASENQLDRAATGTKNSWSWRGKITQQQADEIRALKGVLPQRVIAERYGISRSNVSFIHCGKAWTGIPNKYTGPRARFAADFGND